MIIPLPVYVVIKSWITVTLVSLLSALLDIGAPFCSLIHVFKTIISDFTVFEA